MAKCGFKKKGTRKAKGTLRIGLKGVGGGKGFSKQKHPGNFANVGL